MDELTFKQRLYGDVSVCYSGGLDSTTVALMAARKQMGRVHLHTLRHGYGYLFYWWTSRTVRTLQSAVEGDRILHQYLDTSDLFRDMAMKSFFRDRREYGEPFGCCLGCTLAMIAKIDIYNLENQIPHIMMGSSVGGEYAVMSKPGTVELQKAFCGRYGIRYSAPLLDDRIVKQQERELLDRFDVFRGKRFLDKHSFGNQGYCLLSLQHLPDVLFNMHPEYTPEKVRDFFLKRQTRCEEYIREHFESTGQDLPAAIARLRAISELKEDLT